MPGGGTTAPVLDESARYDSEAAFWRWVNGRAEGSGDPWKPFIGTMQTSEKDISPIGRRGVDYP